MINPQTITEQILFSTIRLQTSAGFGTGFIFNFETSDKKLVPVIITNKHVVNFQEKINVRYFLHVKNNELPGNENIEVSYESTWIFHPDPNIDLCCTPLAPILHDIKNKLFKEIFYKAGGENLIFNDARLEDLKAVEDVLMVGYPTGLFDVKNNLPLFRKGITSSHPAIDFNARSIGVIDVACFPGSSGSPVYILNEGSYSDKRGNTYMGGARIIFLGVLYGGPSYTVDGEIEIKEIPTQQKIITKNQVLINLGYYIKAKELLILKEEVFIKLKL